MAKTQLEIEGGAGWEKLVAVFDKVLASGDSVIDQAKSLGDANEQAAQRALASMEKANKAIQQQGAEIVKAGNLTKAVDAEITKQKQLAAAATLDLIKATGALSAEEQQAFDKLVNLANEFERLQEQAAKLDADAKIIASMADGTQDTADATKELTAAREQLNASLEANRAVAQQVADVLGPLMDESGGIQIPEIPDPGPSVGKLKEAYEVVRKLEESRINIVDEGQLAKVNDDLQKARAEVDRLAKLTTEPPKNMASLRVRIREATEESARLFEQFDGEITPEMVEAAQRAAQLRAEMSDLGNIIEALNPDAKFAAVSQLAQSIAGGFSAVQGVMALLDTESQKVQQTLTKIQAVLALSQGLNSFLGGFGNALKSLNALVLANTATTSANTVAQGANAAATGTATAATTASAGATAALSTAVRGLTAAMAANPILTAAVVLAGIAAALVTIGEDALITTERVEKLVAEVEKFRDIKIDTIGFEQRIALLENEARLLRSGNEAASEREKIDADLATKQEAIALKRQANEEAINKLLEERFLLSNTDAEAEFDADGVLTKLSKEGDEANKKIQEQLDKYLQENNDFNRESEALAQEAANDRLRLTIEEEERKAAEREKAAKEAIERQRAEAALRLKLAEDVAKAEADLSTKVKGGQNAGAIAELEAKADAAAKAKLFEQEAEFRRSIIALKQQSAQEDIDLIQLTLQRKIALQQVELQMGAEAFGKLTELQKQAAADRIIDQGKAELSAEQLAQVQMLRDLARAESERQLTKVTVDEVGKRVGAADEERARALSLIDAEEQLFAIRIDNAQENEAELLKVLKDAGIEGLEFVQSTEEAKTRLAIEFARRRLELLQAEGPLTAEQAIGADKIKAEIAKLEASLKNMKPFGINWAKILGITQEEFNKFAPVINNALAKIKDAVYQSLFTNRIAEVDEYISKLDEQLQATEEVIAREQEAKEQGLTNDRDAQRAHQNELRKMRREAAKEADKIRKQQAIADAAAVVLGAVLTIVNILQQETQKSGWIGVAIAAAAIPAVFAVIQAVQAQGQSSVSAYKDGTHFVERGNNPKGRDKIPAMLDEGEAVIRAEDNRRNRSLIKGLHFGDKELVREGIREAADNYGISWDELMDEFGEKPRMDRMPDLPPLHIQQKVERDRSDIETLRSEEAFNRSLQVHLSRIANSNEQLVAIERGRKERVAIGEGRYREFDQHGNVRTVTITP